jgi:hypothetical protein
MTKHEPQRGTTMGADALRVHQVLGLSETEYELKLRAEGEADVRFEPRWHSHPVLGITGHAHSSVAEARRPHTHRPIVTWDMTPAGEGE